MLSRFDIGTRVEPLWDLVGVEGDRVSNLLREKGVENRVKKFNSIRELETAQAEFGDPYFLTLTAHLIAGVYRPVFELGRWIRVERRESGGIFFLRRLNGSIARIEVRDSAPIFVSALRGSREELLSRKSDILSCINQVKEHGQTNPVIRENLVLTREFFRDNLTELEASRVEIHLGSKDLSEYGELREKTVAGFYYRQGSEGYEFITRFGGIVKGVRFGEEINLSDGRVLRQQILVLKTGIREKPELEVPFVGGVVFVWVLKPNGGTSGSAQVPSSPPSSPFPDFFETLDYDEPSPVSPRQSRELLGSGV